MRFTIVGAGAVGGLLGAMLARAGNDVAFVARGRTRERLIASGIRVELPGGAFETGPFQAEESPAALPPADVVFVSVKSFQVAAAGRLLAPLCAAGAVVIPLQNGVAAVDTLADAVGRACVLGGLCHVLAEAERPGEIVVRGEGLRVTIGELDGASSARVDAIAESLRGAGVRVSLPPDILAAIWEKLLFVGPMGMIGAATGLPAGVFRSVAESRGLLIEAMNEVWRVGRATGANTSEDAVLAALARIDSLPAGATTSMHRDLAAGRPSEIEEQIGAVVRGAERLGEAVPVHRVLYSVLAARVRGRA